MTAKEQEQPQDVIGKRWDQCMAKLLVNSGIGTAVGIGLSVVLFRRRFWPIPMSLGFAAGMSFQECRSTFSLEAMKLSHSGSNLLESLIKSNKQEQSTDASKK